MSEETKADAPDVQAEGNTPAETAPAVETDNKEETATTESEVSVKTEPADYGIEADDPEAGVDWKQRYSDSQKEFQTKYKPLEENFNYFDSLVKEDPVLAKQVQDAVARKQTTPQPYGNIDEIVERKLEERLQPVQGLIAQQEEEQRSKRREDVDTFEKKYGAQLFKSAKNNEEIADIRKELGATALALHKDKRTKSFGEALEKAMIIHNPDVLVRKGESKALAGKASKDQASFSQDTSDSPKGKVADDMTPAQREWLAQMGEEYVK